MIALWAGMVAGAADLERAEEAPRRELRGWERPTLVAGLGIAAGSAGAATATWLVMSSSCRFECLSATLVPVAIGGVGGLVGGTTALIGGVGILAAPRSDGAVVVLTARW